MIVRFGFVAMSTLLEDASPSRTMTYAHFSKLPDREAALRRLEEIARDNLHNTLRLLRHCLEHGVRVYRMTSKLIPLATHDALRDWEPWEALAGDFAAVGGFAKQSDMRVSFHPDHFCVLSTPRPEVLEKSREDLEYHVRMLEAMGLDERAMCNIHVGGAYGDKPASADRFIRQFGDMPERLRRRITLENDDKTFTVRETLQAAEAVGTPMVLDIHHHAVNDGGESEAALVGELWPRILRTWETSAAESPIPGSSPPMARQAIASDETWAGRACREEAGRPVRIAEAEAEEDSSFAAGTAASGVTRRMLLPPKMHVSSPKSAKDPRGHADLVEAGPLLRFLRETAGSAERLDCMLEAKAKDAALFALMDEMRRRAAVESGLRIVDGAAIEIE